MAKTAPAIFLIMHEVVFRPVPLFVHVSSWGNWFLSRTAQSVNKPFQGVGKNRGCLCGRKTSGRAGCYLAWILASRACSKCSFEKIQPYITLTIYEILLYFSFQWVREKPNSLVYISVLQQRELLLCIHQKKPIIERTMKKCSGKKEQVNFNGRSFSSVWCVYVLTEINKFECINQLVMCLLHSKSLFPGSN